MTGVYSEKGVYTPVTVVTYEPIVVTQVKTKEKEGYSALQVGSHYNKGYRFSKAHRGHVKKAGLKNEGLNWLCEILVSEQEAQATKLGEIVNIESLVKGDKVRIIAHSKGRGFSGGMKRWNFKGGPAAHGSKAHRRVGSIGNNKEPSRVFRGKKMPGRFGCDRVTVISEVVDVLPKENALLIKGPIPGGNKSRVFLRKI